MPVTKKAESTPQGAPDVAQAIAADESKARSPRRSKTEIALADFEYAQRRLDKKKERLTAINAERDPLAQEVEQLQEEVDYRRSNPLLREHFASQGEPDALTGWPLADSPQA